MRTAFTELVGVQHPIVGFNRSPGVVAAVPLVIFALLVQRHLVRGLTMGAVK